MTQDITNMTFAEINNLIFGDAHPSKHIGMPVWIAKQVINMPHVGKTLSDWAFDTVLAEIDF